MIVHICSRDDWQNVEDEYRPASLGDVGFVHCADPGTVHLPANALFTGRTDLVLLEIDVAAVGAPVRWEDGDPPHPAGIWFPHVYGPIPRAAVVAVHEFPAQSDGRYLPPGSLTRR
ncbi:DUF952 domain-containing protein [Amycolatopsis sp. NPDC059027]|uniref:DUF952 domain-containing protein n=1 Tax=unclassified Amycolatopsis TaxID=2618356 RepID=UPI00366C0763